MWQPFCSALAVATSFAGEEVLTVEDTGDQYTVSDDENDGAATRKESLDRSFRQRCIPEDRQNSCPDDVEAFARSMRSSCRDFRFATGLGHFGHDSILQFN
jgi:hypothetical protein